MAGSLFTLGGQIAARRPRRGFGRERAEMRLVRIVAMRAEQIALRAVPIAGAPSVDPGPPVAILLAMTLAAESVRFVERYALAAGQVQEIAVIGIVAVEAPAMSFVVLEHDVEMHHRQFAARAIGLLARMAVGTGKNAVGEWRRWNLDFLLGNLRRVGGKKTDADQPGRTDRESTHSATPPCAASRAPTSPEIVAAAARSRSTGSSRAHTRSADAPRSSE